MKSNFEERKANRKARFEELAFKNENESTSRYKAAKSIGDHIPFGQPILVGHHSEGRHRRDLSKIDTNMRKSVEADSKAKYYADRAANIDKEYAIFSDDPEAIVKLKEKIQSLVSGQETMKACNKIIKAKKGTEVEKVELLTGQGLTERQAIEMMVPDYCGRIGFASYALTNNNANITRNKKRLAELVKAESEETTEKEVKGVKVVDSVEDNRLQLYFDGKPSDEVRKDLKSKGFRWSPFNGCWQTHRSEWANRKAEMVLNNL